MSATIAEMLTEIVMVSANCRKSCPVMPLMNADGKKTDVRTSEMPRMGAVSSFIAFSAAANGSSPAFDVVLDALHDDDGVVDDDADGEHQAEERQRVDAEPER